MSDTETETPERASDGLSAEIAGLTRPTPEKPPGSPALLPLSSVPRRARQAYWSFMAELPLDEDGNLAVGIDQGGSAMKAMAAVAGMEAAIADALRVVALPQAKAAFDAWEVRASSEELFALFSWYQSTVSPGEVQPSPTS